MNKEKVEQLCLSPLATIKEAIHRLNQTAEKIIFVTDTDKRLLGTITDGDIRRALLKDAPFYQAVTTVMCSQYTLLRAGSTDLLAQAEKLMKVYHLSHIPVLDDEDHICDVVTWHDFLGINLAVETPKQWYDTVVVIMAGGRGSRLDAFTRVLPKPLIPIGDKPIVELIMERFYQSGFHRFLYTLNYKKEYLKLFFKERLFPYEIDWVEEEEFLGTAGSIALLADKLQETFFVVNCDTLLTIDYAEVLNWHWQQEHTLTVIGSHSEVHIPFGVLELSEGKLSRIREKPTHDVIINTGIYVMEPRVLPLIPRGQLHDMDVFLTKLIEIEKEAIGVYPVYGRDWHDIGQWDGYRKTVEQIEGKDLKNF